MHGAPRESVVSHAVLHVIDVLALARQRGTQGFNEGSLLALAVFPHPLRVVGPSLLRPHLELVASTVENQPATVNILNPPTVKVLRAGIGVRSAKPIQGYLALLQGDSGPLSQSWH